MCAYSNVLGTRENFMFVSSQSHPISSSKGLSLLASRITCILNCRRRDSQRHYNISSLIDVKSSRRDLHVKGSREIDCSHLR